jgi:hypothetical protein
MTQVVSRARMLLFLTLVVSLWAPLVWAQAPQQQAYQGCLQNCADKFSSIAADEKNCEETLNRIHHDLNLIRNLLQRSDLCIGRSKSACNDFLDYARPALDKVLAHTLEVKNCLEVDAKALQDELWLFDTAKACKGDGTFTDLHDFLVAKKTYLEDLNGNSPHYALDRRMFDAYDDFQGHRPECASGARPSLSYVFPLFQIYLALDSLLAYQACLPSCRAPTEAEKRMWALEEVLTKVRDQTESLGTALQERTESRQQKLMDELGMSFPCRPYSDGLLEVRANREALSRLEKALREMQINPGEAAGKLDKMQLEVDHLAAAVKASEILAMDEACAAEDLLARTLLERKRKVVDTVLRGDTFCFEAARVFAQAGEPGTDCQWLGDCNMPLQCTNRKCRGKVSVRQVKGVLDRVKALVDEGLALKTHDEKGLLTTSQRQVHDLEQAVAEAEAELNQHGWQQAVAAWRKAYRTQMPARLEGLASEIDTLATRTDQESDAPSRACERTRGKIADLAQNLTRVQEALGDPDPVLRAKWVRLKSRDADALREELSALEARLEADCGEPQAEQSAMMLYLIIGLAALGLALAAVFFIIKKRR